MKNIAVFVSGNGSNFETIISNIENGNLKCNLPLLVTDKPGCKGVERAKNHGVEVYEYSPKDYKTREESEIAIIKKLEEKNIDFIVFAGFMRIVTETLISKYENKIVNIHPSLLPSFKGAHAIEQAFEYGVKIFGVTIHYVNFEMDGGKIISQKAMSYEEGDTICDVERKIHEIEHDLYVKTLKKLLEEKE